MAHKSEQGKQYIRNRPGQYAYRVARRIIYIWTGFWSFNRAYLAEEPLDVPNICLSTTMTVLALAGLHRLYRANTGRTDAEYANKSLAARFAIVFVFFPLAYYFSHPETYYFRPVDPLIVVLAAYFVSNDSATTRRRFGKKSNPQQGENEALSWPSFPGIFRVLASCQAFKH